MMEEAEAQRHRGWKLKILLSGLKLFVVKISG